MSEAERPHLPLFIDSGGFASLFEGTEIEDHGNFAAIRTPSGDIIDPGSVLALQETYADIGATLDLIVSPKLDEEQARARQELTVKNARWALQNKTRQDLRLFASIQAWDWESAVRCTRKLSAHPFDGFALGGMIPRMKNPKLIEQIVRAIRSVERDRPLHVFGIGQPDLILRLRRAGADTTDSSSIFRSTADKKFLDPKTGTWQQLKPLCGPSNSCNCPVCRKLGGAYLSLNGETNNMALALHNLHALQSLLNG